MDHDKQASDIADLDMSKLLGFDQLPQVVAEDRDIIDTLDAAHNKIGEGVNIIA